jgi:hypothetical protein
VKALASISAAAVLLIATTGTAEAAPLAKDGKVHACYRVKGKPKGAVRIVRNKRSRCRRGERKIAWIKAASPGAQGANGQPGASANEAALRAEIATLRESVEALSARLLAVEGVVEAVCSQVSVLTGLLPLGPFSCPSL